MALAISLFIAAGVAIYVAAPLLSAETAGDGTLPIDVTPAVDLKRRRLVVYENLQDLEFEYKAGKISNEDYQGLRESYFVEAAQLMLNSQEVEKLSESEALIEREVAERRARRKMQAEEDYVCPECGFENPLPVKFCGDCGARLSPRRKRK